MSQVSVELHHEISQFLYQEAALLDEWRFREWLDVLAEDISYTLRTTQMHRHVIVVVIWSCQQLGYLTTTSIC